MMAVAAGIALVAAVLFLLRPAAGTRRTVDAVGAPRVAAAAPSPAPPGSPGGIPTVTGGPRPALPALDTDAVARNAAAEYRHRARYPRSSQPLDGGDPVERDREVSRITQRGPSGEDPALTVYPL